MTDTPKNLRRSTMLVAVRKAPANPAPCTSPAELDGAQASTEKIGRLSGSVRRLAIHFPDGATCDLLNIEMLLTTVEASEFIGLSAKALENKRHSGLNGPPFVRLGGKRGAVRYRVRDLLAWIDANTFRSTSDKGGVE